MKYKKPDSNIVIVSEKNYYPFGLKHKGYNTGSSSHLAEKKGFISTELQEENNINWYDVTARNYDPALGRWMNLDPLAEKMRRHSPYNFAFNNPIYFTDPDGMAPIGPGDPSPITTKVTRSTIRRSFRYSNISHTTGNDYVTHTKSTTYKFKNKKGKLLYTTTQITNTTTVINEKGVVGDVNVSSTIYTNQNGKVGEVPLAPKTIDMADAPEEFKNYTDEVSSYKIDNRESPSQTQAEINMATKQKVDAFSIPTSAGSSYLAAKAGTIASGFAGVVTSAVALAISSEIKTKATEIGTDKLIDNKTENIKTKNVNYEY